MEKRLLLIEPNLYSVKGHYYQNSSMIQNELHTRGIVTMILGCRDSDAVCQQLPMFYSAFSHILIKGISPFAKLTSLITASWRFYWDVARVFACPQLMPLKPNDVLYMNTVLDHQIFGWGLILWLHASRFKRQNLKFVFLLKFRPIRRSRWHTALIKAVSWLAFKKLMHGLRNHVVLCTETEHLQKEYGDLLHRPISVLPLPMPVALNGVKDPPALASQPLTITYLGGNAPYKGFDVLIKALEQLCKTDLRRCHFKLQAQVSQHLQQLLQKSNTIDVLPEFLPLQQYTDLFRETDILVLPYRSIHYKASTSGMFAEALAIGKIPIVPQNTWMGAELVRFKLERLTFRQEDPQDLAKVLSHVIENHLHYKEMMVNVRKTWQSQHNPEKFVDALLELIGWESPVRDHKNLAVHVA